MPNATGIDLIAVGSCVLLWHRGNRYLVTASHVLDIYPGHAIYLGTNTAWVEIPGPFRQTTSSKGRADAMDFAFAPVSEESASKLDGCHFLTGDQISPDERVIFTPPYRSKYTAFGFPLNRFDMSYPTRTSYPKNIAATATVGSREQYSALGLSVDGHIVLEFDQDAVVGPKGPQSSPKLDGISGGGVFRMPALETVGSAEPPLLAGVIIEQDRKERLLVAVRLGVILAAINSISP